MKKSFILAGLLALAVTVALLAYFQPVGTANAETTPCISMQVTNTGCAKVECGSCPGAACKIGGICCVVPGTAGAPDRDGIAECGCVDGEPSCTCKVGQPR